MSLTPQKLMISHLPSRGRTPDRPCSAARAVLELEDGDFRLTLTGHLRPDIPNDTRLVHETKTDQSGLNAAPLPLRLAP